MSENVGVKTLLINDQEVSARSGQTILEVARENDIYIPTLCHLDGLTDVGACRLCVVEIKGNNKLFAACVTTVFEGMEVSTETERLRKHRRTILELLFAERNHVCSVCVSNGHCDLQAMAQEPAGHEQKLRLAAVPGDVDVDQLADVLAVLRDDIELVPVPDLEW